MAHAMTSAAAAAAAADRKIIRVERRADRRRGVPRDAAAAPPCATIPCLAKSRRSTDADRTFCGAASKGLCANDSLGGSAACRAPRRTPARSQARSRRQGRATRRARRAREGACRLERSTSARPARREREAVPGSFLYSSHHKAFASRLDPADDCDYTARCSARSTMARPSTRRSRRSARTRCGARSRARRASWLIAYDARLLLCTPRSTGRRGRARRRRSRSSSTNWPHGMPGRHPELVEVRRARRQLEDGRTRRWRARVRPLDTTGSASSASTPRRALTVEKVLQLVDPTVRAARSCATTSRASRSLTVSASRRRGARGASLTSDRAGRRGSARAACAARKGRARLRGSPSRSTRRAARERRGTQNARARTRWGFARDRRRNERRALVRRTAARGFGRARRRGARARTTTT